MGDKAKEINDNEFETQVLGAQKPVLVDFWAEWCGPCRSLGPTVDAIADEYKERAGVFKLNIDENSSTPQRLGIRSIPTLVVFKDGIERERLVGAVSREAVATAIDKYL